MLLGVAQVGQGTLQAGQQVVRLFLLGQQFAAARFQLLPGGREVGNHLVEGRAQLPNFVPRTALHALREVAPAHAGGGIAQLQYGHRDAAGQHEADANANAEDHETEKQRGNANLPLALHDFAGGGAQQDFAAHHRGQEAGPLHHRRVVGSGIHVNLAALGVGFEHRARNAGTGVGGVPDSVDLKQAHELQQRVFLYKIHGSLHALEILLSHGNFHAQRHGVGLVLHVLVEVVQQALPLNGREVKKDEEGEEQYNARHGQPDFSLDREAHMPDDDRERRSARSVCHAEPDPE